MIKFDYQALFVIYHLSILYTVTFFECFKQVILICYKFLLTSIKYTIEKNKISWNFFDKKKIEVWKIVTFANRQRSIGARTKSLLLLLCCVHFFLLLSSVLFVLSLCVSFRFAFCGVCACEHEIKDFIPVCTTVCFFKQKDMYSFSHIYPAYVSRLCKANSAVSPVQFFLLLLVYLFECSFFCMRRKRKQNRMHFNLLGLNTSENL